MRNIALTAAIMRIVRRLDPVPVRKDTLAAEIDIALAEPVTTAEFSSALADLRRGGFIEIARDPLLGETVALTDDGRKAAERLLG